MRNYREIFKKLSDKDFLTKSIAVVSIAILRNLNELAQRLNFECFQILMLLQYFKTRDFEFHNKNDKSLLIIDIEDELKTNKCELFYNRNYEQNRKFLFVAHLQNDKNEQIENITIFFRMQELYLSCYDSINDKITTCLQQKYTSMKNH